jgi:hypothetical protein
MATMAMMDEKVRVFRLRRLNRVDGYVAIRQASYRWNRRQGFRLKRWASTELEASFFVFAEGRATGFEIVTNMANQVARGTITYRGEEYALEDPAEDEAEQIWREQLCD